jgi:oligopeptide transport system substrate-binding protein
VLRIGDIGEPFSLDPSFAGGAQEAVLASNLMDPLVRLSKDSEAAPNLATSWDMSRDLRKIIFHLSHDGRWTNGDPLTAHDFEWAWKRAMSPELDAPLAYQFYGISGARAYHDCKPKNADCDALRAQVGVTAVDDFTLEVRLNSPQPWFPVQVAHPAFLPVHRATVEKFGKAWTDPENIVTSGPFRLASWRHGASLTLEKNDAWRKADQVALNRVEFRFIPDPETRAQAFESGRLEAARLAGAAPSELKRFKQTEEFALYAIAGLFYIGINVQNIPDPNQRLAMALAIDHRTLFHPETSEGVPATDFIPPGLPGFDQIASDYLPLAADLSRARELMSRVPHPRTKLTLFTNDSPDNRRVLEEAKRAWTRLGITSTIKILGFSEYVALLGPPPSGRIDVFATGWIGDFLDAYNFLELFTCDSPNNFFGFCDHAYDHLLARARSTGNKADRYALYGNADARLVGPQGLVPLIPVNWYTDVWLVRRTIRPSFTENALGLVDLAQVKVEAD